MKELEGMEEWRRRYAIQFFTGCLDGTTSTRSHNAPSAEWAIRELAESINKAKNLNENPFLKSPMVRDAA